MARSGLRLTSTGSFSTSERGPLSGAQYGRPSSSAYNSNSLARAVKRTIQSSIRQTLTTLMTALASSLTSAAASFKVT